MLDKGAQCSPYSVPGEDARPTGFFMIYGWAKAHEHLLKKEATLLQLRFSNDKLTKNCAQEMLILVAKSFFLPPSP